MIKKTELLLLNHQNKTFRGIVIDVLDANKLQVILEGKPLNLAQAKESIQQFGYLQTGIIEIEIKNVIRKIGHCPKRSFYRLVNKKLFTKVVVR